MEDLAAYFDSLLTRVPSLYSIALTDRDGVYVMKAENPDAEQYAVPPILSCSFAIASEQAGKLGLGRNQSIVTFFDSFQLLQLNHSPLYISMLADAKANTGLLLDLGNELLVAIAPLKEALVQKLAA